MHLDERDSNTKWEAKATGDMTLSVVDETGFQVLKIDMLKRNTMKAGTDGVVLLRSYNDLALIAGFPDSHYDTAPEYRMYPDEQISELPWCCEYLPSKRTLVVRNRDGIIADRVFPKKIPEETISLITQIIQFGVTEINQRNK